ncbi:MAG: class I cytochrome c [Pseudomonadota bacterium]|nr:class I cytochrome c [Pseudomonadota bacterium]
MKSCPVVLAGALLAVSGWASAQAMDFLQVRGMAAACAGCHGTHGLARSGPWSLAGAGRDELLQKMLAFKTGARPATVMHQITRGYSNEELGALAAYFSIQKK